MAPQCNFLRFLFLILLIAPLMLTGCDLFGEEENDDIRLETTGALVANGGNFTDQNGFITTYDPATNQAASPPELELNAFINSLTLREDTVYAVLNTGFSSGRIDQIDLETYAREQIDSLGAVRALAFAENGKAYATVRNGTVVELDFAADEVVGAPIQVGAAPDGLTAADDKVFVANYGSSGAGTTLSVIDPASNQVTSTMELGCDGPSELFMDEEDELAVVCQGKTVYNDDFSEILDRTNGQILFVNSETETIIDRISTGMQLSSANGTQGAYYSAEEEALFAISSGTGQVVRVDTDDNEREATIAVPAAEELVGLTAVAYDATADELYLARFPVGEQTGQASYTAAGAVVVLDENGALADRFTVGPSPAHIALRRKER